MTGMVPPPPPPGNPPMQIHLNAYDGGLHDFPDDLTQDTTLISEAPSRAISTRRSRHSQQQPHSEEEEEEQPMLV